MKKKIGPEQNNWSIIPQVDTVSVDVEAVQPETGTGTIEVVDLITLLPIDGISYKTAQSAGVDLSSTMQHTLLTGETKIFSTGVRLLVKNWSEAPEKVTAALLMLRSSLRAKGISGVDTGLIDLDYEGEIKVILHNHSDRPKVIAKGDRIAQLVFIETTRPNGIPISEVKREGGLGSTNS